MGLDPVHDCQVIVERALLPSTKSPTMENTGSQEPYIDETFSFGRSESIGGQGPRSDHNLIDCLYTSFVVTTTTLLLLLPSPCEECCIVVIVCSVIVTALDCIWSNSINPSLVSLKEQISMRSVGQATTYDRDLEDTPAHHTFVSTERYFKISVDLIAERFGIGPERAKATLRATTQRGMRSAILPIGCQYRADRMFNVKRLTGKFATDTL
jgi:hypothetical protein